MRMLCPVDQNELQMTVREGVEIDYCPKCRGVWLDRGELDKIIDRTAADLAQAQPAAPPPQPMGRPHDDRRHDKDYYERKRKKSFLSEIFD